MNSRESITKESNKIFKGRKVLGGRGRGPMLRLQGILAETNWAKNLALCTQNTGSKTMIVTLLFKKNAFFRRKWWKIA
jgi:hypothetical protein